MDSNDMPPNPLFTNPNGELRTTPWSTPALSATPVGIPALALEQPDAIAPPSCYDDIARCAPGNNNDALQKQMERFFTAMTTRIQQLEACVQRMGAMMQESGEITTDVNTVLNLATTSTRDPSTVVSDNVKSEYSPSSTDAKEAVTPPLYELHFEGVTEQFYTERPYPPFTIKVCPVETPGRPSGDVHLNAHDWKVQIRLIDGNGRYVDDKLGDDKAKMQYLKEGVAEVTGLRFKKVSSKNGGFYRLEASVIAPDAVSQQVRAVRSDKITILSCRLFNCRKRSISKLHPTDSVSKLPGIGRAYGERLTVLGISTLQDLASLPVGDDSVSKQRRHEILDRIRKDKGIMVDSKFVSHIKTAKEICDVKNATPISVDAVMGSVLSKRSAPATLWTGDEQAAKRTEMDFHMSALSALAERPNIDSFLNPDEMSDGTTGLGLSGFSWDARDEGACRGVAVDKRPGDAQSTAFKAWPLHMAVATGRINVVRKAMALTRTAKREMNELNHQKFTPLMLSCALGHVAIVELFLGLPGSNAWVSQSGHAGFNALHVAAMGGQVECAKKLLAKGVATAGVGARTDHQWTALMMATVQGSAELVKLLLQLQPQTGNDLSAEVTTDGLGLKHLAALSGNLEVVKMVFDATSEGARAGAGAGRTVPSVLHCAAFSGCAEVVRHVLAEVTEPPPVYMDGWTPLHVCAYRGFPECISMLLKQSKDLGFDVNTRTDQGWTALSLAAMTTTGECTEILLQHGATDDGSKVPASMVSVICANIESFDALNKTSTVRGDFAVGGARPTVSVAEVDSSML